MSICIKKYILYIYIYFTYIYTHTHFISLYIHIYYRDEREERLEGVELTRILTRLVAHQLPPQGGGEACRLKAWVPLSFHVFLFPQDERIKLLQVLFFLYPTN